MWLSSNDRGNPNEARGLTLLELLIVLGLVLAIAAITLPTVLNQFDDRAFEAAGDSLVAQLLMARAAAQTRNKPVEVIYNSDRSMTIARYFEVSKARLQQDDREEQRFGRGEFELTQSESDLTIPDPWAEQSLDEAYSIVDHKPRPENQLLLTASEFRSTSDTVLEASSDEATRLVVYSSDGAALFVKDLWLVDTANRVGRIVINGWTGDVGLIRGDDLSDDEDTFGTSADDDFARFARDNVEDNVDETETSESSLP